MKLWLTLPTVPFSALHCQNQQHKQTMKKADMDPLVEKFNCLKENDFSKLVMLPLLRSLGYTGVQFHGGPTENGRDIIGFKKDAFNTTEGTVFVVKRLKKTTAARMSGTFHESVRQLEQAAETNIPFLDGHRRRPNEVVFVTPHLVTVRMLESRFNKFLEIRKNRLKYLDGEKIAELCREHCPEICKTILGTDRAIAEALKDLYTNETLLNLLGKSACISVDSYHVGLDFNMGSRSLADYLASSYLPKGSGATVETEAEIAKLNVYLEAERSFSIPLVDIDSYKAAIEGIKAKKANVHDHAEISRASAEIAKSNLAGLYATLSEIESTVSQQLGRERRNQRKLIKGSRPKCGIALG